MRGRRGAVALIEFHPQCAQRLDHTRPPTPEPGGHLFSRQLRLVRARAVRAQARGIAAAMPTQPAPGSARAAPQRYLAINVYSFAPGGVRSIVAPIGEGDKGGEGDQASGKEEVHARQGRVRALLPTLHAVVVRITFSVKEDLDVNGEG